MKLSRRCFLSLVVGGAAGTALTPLPWKLQDDLSIWSQNWPWTPVPPDGEATYTVSTCALCPGGCGINVRKIDERGVKIEGAKGHPVNDGGVCMLGLSALQLLYSPTRVKTPLKQVGKKGEGRWEAISWKQAIEEVSAKLAGIRAQGNPQSVACIASRDSGTVSQLLNRLLTAFGSPNFVRMPSIEDAGEASLRLTQGVAGSMGADVENADFILSFGCAILDGYGSPVRMFRANSGWKEKHAVLVQVEPRLSNTAAKSDQWLAIRPGSETDLALAMANVIISKNLYHKEFVSQHSEGLTAFARMVREKYAPDAVAGRIGVYADKIVELAEKFATAKKPLALYGRGKGQTPGSLKEALAVHTLNALVGNINQPGGVFAVPEYDYISWPEVPADEIAAAGLKTARLDDAGTDKNPHARYLVNRLIASADNLQALLVADANPCYALPGAGAVKAAIEKIPFVVSFSSFMDETAMGADYILPNHYFLERYEDLPVTAGLTQRTVGLCRPVVEPQCDTQHLGDTIIQIAHALSGSIAEAFPWEDYQTCLQETVGDQWETLEANGYLVSEATPASWADGFGTASGKFEFMSGTLGAIYLADEATPQGDSASFSLMLVAYDSIRLASRRVGDPPFMMKTVPDTVLKGQDSLIEINSQTADKLGLAEGQLARLTTPIGQATVRVHRSQGLPPDVVALPRGLGHTAYDRYLAGKGVNVNQLIGPVEDPASGLDAVWGIRANLAKA